MLRAALTALLVIASPALADSPCVAGCTTELGTYNVRVPDGPGPHPVLLHLHGMGGTGDGVLRGGTAKAALARGYAVIAPDGWQPISRYPKNWGVYDGRPYTRDDTAFLREVLADAAEDHPI
ncbi:MAG: polyhydroxybutyrate depolymerase, partial [Pseudomonadota bacterium]